MDNTGSLNRASLQAWVANEVARLEIQCEQQTVVLTPLSGDAGFRQYFRVNTVPPMLAVMAPKTQGVSESAQYFERLSVALRQHQVCTPAIVACDAEQNYMLIESFGDRSLLDELSSETVDALYSQSLMTLMNIQQVPFDALVLPEYDEELLLREMALFPQWFVQDLLGYSLSEGERADIASVFEFLTAQALEQPKVLVHRDYHSRNLMYRQGIPPGVIDFQDAVWGPVTYDLVSLLRDCYVRWSPAQVRKWALGYANMAHQADLIGVVSEEQFMRWFDTMGLQRHIKVLGIFARLYLRDGKARYLDDLPLVIRYVLDVARQHPQTQAFADWFEQQLLPLIQQQSWYRPYESAGE